MGVTLDSRHLGGFVAEHELAAIEPQVQAAHKALHDKTGLGSDFLGWLGLPEDHDREELARIKAAAEKIKKDSDLLIVIGIGGSYLGARAAIEFLRSPFYNNLKKDTPDIYFAGCNLSPSYLNSLLALCEGREVSVNVISKSGTTTEPALAFRVFRELLEKRYGPEEARKRIYCTTDKARGTLKTLADQQGFECFVIPDDVGGRYSVLTAVGLLPIAVAGCDLDAILAGARKAQADFSNPNLANNDCYRYAALRNILYRKGKQIEILAAYEPAFVQMAEWFKQLFGESEGKDGKGLFPAAVNFSADLHSMGQMIQAGQRNIFETVVIFDQAGQDYFIKEDPDNPDGLGFLSGQNLSLVNRKAFEGTVLAHVEGGVPNLVLKVDSMSEADFGYLVYFFEKACAISGYLLGVNPFDQPGVESYKQNMFALLGKPGFEKRKAELESRLK